VQTLDQPQASQAATEHISPRFRDLDRWPAGEVLLALWEGQLAAVAAVRPCLPAIAAAVEGALPRLLGDGRLVYAGAGTSGRIGVQDGAELPPTFDWPEDRIVLLLAGGAAALTRSMENVEDDRAAAAADVVAHGIGANDVVIGTAASGSTPYTVTVLVESARRGALTIGVANSPGSPLLAAASHPILLETGAEAIAGSTRLGAGTAQKVVLNLISCLAMVRLGRIHRGLMVDMNARNAKLRARAVGMLRELTGREEEAIRTALAEAGGRVKLALLLLHGIDRARAESLLAQHGGHLHAVLAGLGE
jgi:N-acetylmuramic acid 6-phosphate etherase